MMWFLLCNFMTFNYVFLKLGKYELWFIAQLCSKWLWPYCVMSFGTPYITCGMWINNQCKSHSVHPKLCHNMLLPPKLQTAHLHVHIKASKNIRFDLTPLSIGHLLCSEGCTYELQTSWGFHLYSQLALKRYFFPISFNCFEKIDCEWQKTKTF